MTTPHPQETPQQLAGFPESVRAAYEDFTQTGDPASAQVVILGALRDFLPSDSDLGPEDPLEDSERLIEDLGYDSVAVAEIVFFIEDLFGVTLHNQDLKEVQTVGRLKEFVSEKIAEKHSAA